MSGICKPLDNCEDICSSQQEICKYCSSPQFQSKDNCFDRCCQWIPSPGPSPGPSPPPSPDPGLNQMCKMLEKDMDIECKELKKMLPNYNSCKKIPEKSLFVNTLTMVGCDSKTASSIYDKLNNCFCKKLSTGAIIGIVIGSLVGLGLIIFLSIYFSKKNKHNK